MRRNWSLSGQLVLLSFLWNHALIQAGDAQPVQSSAPPRSAPAASASPPGPPGADWRPANAAIFNYNDGINLMNSAKYDQAAEKFRAAIQISPQFADAHANLGAALLGMGQPSEGLTELEKSTQLKPDLALGWLNLGSCQQSLGKNEQAVKSFRRYISLDPKSSRVPQLKSLIATLENEVKRTNGAKEDNPENYLNDAVQNGMVRWPQSRLPITVCFKSGAAVPGYKPEYLEIVKEAMKDWEAASDGKISFNQSNDPEAAEMTVSWTDNPKDMISAAEGGHALVIPDKLGIFKVNLTLLTRPSGDWQVTPAYAKRVAMHELGHALGMLGHSRDPNDVMFSSVSAAVKDTNLSQRDKNTLVALYSADPAKFGNGLDMQKMLLTGDPNSVVMQTLRLNSEAKAASDKGNMPLALQKLEAAYKLDPKNELINTNLGTLYATMANLCATTNNLPNALTLYKKAIAYLEKGTNKTNLAAVLRNYSTVLRMSRQTDEAAKIDARLTDLDSKN